MWRKWSPGVCLYMWAPEHSWWLDLYTLTMSTNGQWQLSPLERVRTLWLPVYEHLKMVSKKENGAMWLLNSPPHSHPLCCFCPAVPSASPISPGASALSSDSIQISWQPPPLPDQNGVITGYTINITSLDSGVTLQRTTATNTLQVSNLSPFTIYSCTLAAMTAVGLGPFSYFFTVQTHEDGKITVTQIESGKIMIKSATHASKTACMLF